MSSDSEEPGDSRSDRTCRCDKRRAQDVAVIGALDAGVEFQDPTSVYIDAQAEIERGAWVGAGSHILGHSRIESEARIGPNVIIENSRIGSGATVQSFSIVTEVSDIGPDALIKNRSEVRGSVVEGKAEIGPNALVEDSHIAAKAKVGPFCRVRVGSEIGVDAYIGTQAEVKASRIGEGSKIGHFSFIGDAKLGKSVNIGAGSVTANFDGHDVQRTVIGDDVSVGAGCVLIAPLRLGSGSRTGAGAVVTRDVADGELVLGVPARVHSNGLTQD